jgi:glycosyltransferase involved in cell wall biosynthesis
VIFGNARMSKDKGTLFLVRAFAAFVKSYPGYELWLCNGSYPFGNRSAALQEVLHEIAELGIAARVRFLPHLAWAEIPQLIRQSWAVVLPTLSETFGRAALETLACGVPLVVSRIDTIPSLVRDGALLTEPRSPQSIYEALVRLVKDEALYERLATQGPSIAAPYDRPLVAQQFLQLMQTRIEGQGCIS